MSGYSAVVKMTDEVRTGTKSSFEKDIFINVIIELEEMIKKTDESKNAEQSTTKET